MALLILCIMETLCDVYITCQEAHFVKNLRHFDERDKMYLLCQVFVAYLVTIIYRITTIFHSFANSTGKERISKSFGLSSGKIPNKSMKASSEADKYHAAFLARLNFKPKGRFKGGWSAKKNNRRQWIQVDFKRYRRVTKVATQGRADAKQYVTSFAVASSPDGYRWTPFRVNSRLKVRSNKKKRLRCTLAMGFIKVNNWCNINWLRLGACFCETLTANKTLLRLHSAWLVWLRNFFNQL